MAFLYTLSMLQESKKDSTRNSLKMFSKIQKQSQRLEVNKHLKDIEANGISEVSIENKKTNYLKLILTVKQNSNMIPEHHIAYKSDNKAADEHVILLRD